MATRQRAQGKIAVHVPENQRAAAHANVVRSTITNDGEVLFDFVFIHPQDKSEDKVQQATLVSRVVIPQSVAKRFLTILVGQLGKPQKE